MFPRPRASLGFAHFPSGASIRGVTPAPGGGALNGRVCRCGHRGALRWLLRVLASFGTGHHAHLCSDDEGGQAATTEAWQCDECIPG